MPIAKTATPTNTHSFLVEFSEREARYVKVTVLGHHKNPDWHAAPGAKNWIFLDEILVH